MIKYIVLLILVLGCKPKPKTVEVVTTKGHKLEVTGVIRGDYSPSNHTDLKAMSTELNEVVRSGIKFVTIRINSVGGHLFPTVNFIRSMKSAQARGVTFICVVDGQASSAALMLLTACDERYALFGSTILWHSVGRFYMGKVDSINLAQMLRKYNRYNEKYWKDTREYFPDSYWRIHFIKETNLNVSEIQKINPDFLTVIGSLK